MTHACRLCRGHDLAPMIDLGRLPIAHRMLERADQPEELFGFALHVCRTCGLAQIITPIDPGILYAGYNFNFSSWKPEPHMGDELDLLCQGGAPASVLDIGCNDGRFLSELKARGTRVCAGIEPNPVPAGIARERGHHVYSGMVTAETAGQAVAEHGRFDAVVSRQVFEHVLDLSNFLICADRLLAPGGILFLDLPDFEPALRQADISLLWEEHVSYFVQPVLLDCLARHGFAAEVVRKYDFSGGTIAVKARRADTRPTAYDPAEIIALAEGFGAGVAAYGRRLRQALSDARTAGSDVVLYGVGCRACTTVNGLGLAPSIQFGVDDQVERQGLFMPGSRLPIKPSSALTQGQGPAICLLAVNNENEDKVTAKVLAETRRPVHFVTLFSPRDIHASLAALEASLTP